VTQLSLVADAFKQTGISSSSSSKGGALIFFVLCTIAQMCFVGLFSYVLITWFHIHHAPMDPIDFQQQRRRVLAVSSAATVVSVTGALCLCLLPEHFAVIAMVLTVLMACLSLLLSFMFTFYGYKVGKAQSHRIQTASRKTETSKETEAIRTWRLTCFLAVLFALQSLAWALSIQNKSITVDGASLIYHAASVATMAVISQTYRKVWRQQTVADALRSSKFASRGSRGRLSARTGKEMKNGQKKAILSVKGVRSLSSSTNTSPSLAGPATVVELGLAT